jgi:hypothetical protein
MKHTIKSCDRCKNSDESGVIVKSYRINMGKEMDPSGNGYQTNWEYVDSCENCFDKLMAKYGNNIISTIK